jgi:hypothetical protein
MLVDMNLECYCNYAIYKGKIQTLYAQMMYALYGNQSSSNFYMTIRKDIEQIRLKSMITIHVLLIDNVKVSHKDFRVNNKFFKRLESMNGYSKLTPVITARQKHENRN